MDKKVVTLLKRQCYVDGQWVGEPALSVTNPATGEEVAKVPLTDTRDNFSRIVTDIETAADGLYVLTKGGKPAIALISIQYLEKLMNGQATLETDENKTTAEAPKAAAVPQKLPSETTPPPSPVPKPPVIKPPVTIATLPKNPSPAPAEAPAIEKPRTR